jgi:hypothetical protein
MLLRVGPRGASLSIKARRVGGLHVWKAARVGIRIALLQLLIVMLHHVAPVAASYSCSSDAVCQYPGCDNRNGGWGTVAAAYCHDFGSGDRGDICTFYVNVSSLFPTLSDLGSAQRGENMLTWMSWHVGRVRGSRTNT